MQQKQQTIIASLRYYIAQNGLSPESPELIDLKTAIATKREQIQKISESNTQQMLVHYNKYYFIKNQKKILEKKCEQFSSKLELNRKLNLYKVAEIENKLVQINKLDVSVKKVRDYLEFIQNAKNAMKSKEQLKYNNMIRFIHKLQTQDLPLRPQWPLTKIVPQLNKVVAQYLSELLKDFALTSRKVFNQIGTMCFEKAVQVQNQKKTIYQILFNQTNRSSSNGSFVSSSMVGLPIQFVDRGTRSAKLNDNFLNKKGKPQDILRVKAKINHTPLKQLQFLYTEMGQQDRFRYELRDLCRQELKKFDCADIPSFKNMLKNMIGLLLISRQLATVYSLTDEISLLLMQSYAKIRNYIKPLCENMDQINEMRISLQMFSKILSFLQFQKDNSAILALLKEVFKYFLAKKKIYYNQVIQEMIKKDPHTRYVPPSSADRIAIQRVIGIEQQEENQITQKQFDFTQIIPFSNNIFKMFLDEIVEFTELIEDKQLHAYFQEFFNSVLESFRKYHIELKEPLLMCQAIINSRFLDKIFHYYCNQIQINYDIPRPKEFKYFKSLENLQKQIEAKIIKLLKLKVEETINAYYSLNWTPNDIRSTHHDFLEWFLDYLYFTFEGIRSFQIGFDERIIQQLFSFLNKKYLDIFLSQIKQFNLQALSDLDRDMVYMIKFTSVQFSRYSKLMDKLNPITQFLDLMLKGNLNDLLDPTRKKIQYSALQLDKMKTILRKYNFSKPHMKLKELKKRDVEQILRRLQQLK